MRQILQAIWWWTRVALIVVVGLYALLSLWKNSGQSVEVWYWFSRREETSVVALAVASFLAGGVLCSTGLALFTATLRYRRTREHRRLRAIEEHRETLAKKASMLRTKPAPAPIVRQPKEPARETALLPIVVEQRDFKPSSKPPTRIEVMETSVADSPIHVEASRATPFASTPAIDPTAKVVEPLPIVDEPKG